MKHYDADGSGVLEFSEFFRMLSGLTAFNLALNDNQKAQLLELVRYFTSLPPGYQ